MVELKDNPAKFSEPILDKVQDILVELNPEERVKIALDGMAGKGNIHKLSRRIEWLQTIGVEIEPEWALTSPKTVVGDFLKIDLSGFGLFDFYISSPVYGNRMSDSYVAKDLCKGCDGEGFQISLKSGNKIQCTKCNGNKLSKRYTYRSFLGRKPSEGSSATLHFPSEGYKLFHYAAWKKVYEVLKPGAFFVLNTSDFIKNKEVVRVTDWHVETVLDSGLWEPYANYRVETARVRHGENHQARVEHEDINVFMKRS